MTASTENLKGFNPARDDNGQGMTDDPADKARFDDRLGQLTAEPTGDAETARLASGFKSEDGTAATEAVTPPENIARISDPTAKPAKATSSAIERATAALGDDD